ncbi:TIR domain-containing protein [Clostridioides difficile]|nr:TIR domain-containing protein [Clostridioides difficile]NJK16119.1 TIR domain-containing protein [Clostridioides difficile]
MTEKSTDDIKKVFISYSWTTQEHEKWVLSLAERLMNDGIETILDKWDLEEGHDKYKFMEKMVQDESINKVLIVCDKGYKEKADDRIGGVGTETQIITPELYNKSSQTKFIPIIAEKGETSFDEYMPHYLKSRIAIDMSNEAVSSNSYEQLIRNIYDQPLYQKPKLGKKPSFLDNKSKTTSKLYFFNEELKIFIKDNRINMIESKAIDFKDVFFEELDNFIIYNNDLNEPYDENIVNNIDEMKLLRNHYLNFLELLILGHDSFAEDIIVEFFEEIYSYTIYKGTESFSITFITDHFKFLITELFLWSNLILYKYKKYNIMANILNTRYFVKVKYVKESLAFRDFRFYLKSFESRNLRLNLHRYSLMADKLIDRANYNNKNYKNLLIEIDFLLHYVSRTYCERSWFPTTYIYKDILEKVSILEKMVKRKYFNEIKLLFRVDTKEEMKALIQEKLSEDIMGYGDYIPNISTSINIDEIGKF